MPAIKISTTHFRLDPEHPPTLTAEQEARLKAAEIDYSDIPEVLEGFFGSIIGRS